MKKWKLKKPDFGLDRAAFMLRYLKGSAVIYAAGLAATAAYPLLNDVFSGQLYKVVTDWGDGVSHFAAGMARVVALMVFIIVLSAVGKALFLRATAAADRALRAAMVHSLLHMPMNEWRRRHSGDWITALGKDADNATDVYKEQVIRAAGAMISVVGGAVLLARESLPMTLFSFAVGLVYMSIGATRVNAMKRVTPRVRAVAARVAEQFSNLLAGAWPARFYGVGPFLLRRHTEAADETYRSERGVLSVQSLVWALGGLGYTLCYSGALILGLLLVHAGRLELPVMLSLWPISMGVSFGLTDLGFFVAEFQPTVAAVDRVRAVLDLPEEAGGALASPRQENPAAEWEHVTFTYEGAAQPAVSDVCLRVEAGERVAFVGGSGSGKTTLMKLLLRLYEPDAGRVRVFGDEAKAYALPALRALIGYVPQSARLFSGTIKDNLLLVNPKATDEEIERCCRRAGAQFIAALPGGLEAGAGESGARLSGGQRQRIAIARAFLKSAPALIFDEVTAALDGESEEAILGALRGTGRDQTLLLITHRLSTALIADRIVVLEGGRIVETGAHEELLARGGAYSRLWESR